MHWSKWRTFNHRSTFRHGATPAIQRNLPTKKICIGNMGASGIGTPELGATVSELTKSRKSDCGLLDTLKRETQNISQFIFSPGGAIAT
jgi:hypothetical protein